MLTYRALIMNKSTGERDTLKLGKLKGITTACRVAAQKCPAGWTVIDVSKT